MASIAKPEDLNRSVEASAVEDSAMLTATQKSIPVKDLSRNTTTLEAPSQPSPSPEPRLEKVVTGSEKQDMVFSLSNPNNPAGAVLDQASRPSKAGAPLSKPKLLEAPAGTDEPRRRQESSTSIAGSERPKSAEKHPSPSSQLDQTPDFWIGYNKAADFEDREFVKAAGGNLDTLLIFAGLFSGVNTAFIIESLKTVQPDQAATTNDLIRSVILVLQNTTTPEDILYSADFVPSSRSVRSTAMFFASLSCSLAAAFSAVLGKQWLTSYEREGRLKSPADRGRERHKKYEGRAEWHLEGVIETLPTILQISLFLFLAALVDFLWPINRASEGVVLAFAVALGCFYIITTTIATVYPLSPFQTRLSITIRTLIPKVKGAMWNLLKHPLKELADWSDLRSPIFRDMSTSTPLYQRIYQVVVILALWAPCLLWRLGNFILYLVWRLPHGLLNHFSSHPNLQPPVTTLIANAMLDLKCLMFYAERASSSGDLKQLLAGANALPTSLDLPPDHPFLTSLGETLLKSIIKPTGESGSASSSLSANEFQHLLKPLHHLYTSWKRPDHSDHPGPPPYSSPYFNDYVALIWRKLWDVFVLNPQNLTSASQVAAIFDLVMHSDSKLQGFDMPLALIQNSTLSLVAGNPDSWPYTKLLTISLDSTKTRDYPQGVDIPKLWDTFILALRDSVDVDYVRQRVWIELPPDRVEEIPLEPIFSKYLAQCCNTYLYNDEILNKLGWAEKARLKDFSAPVHLSCLRSVYKLLHRNSESSQWPQTLENDEIPSVILQISRQQPRHHAVWGLACLCFVSLWGSHQRRDQVATSQHPPPYLFPDSVGVIAQASWYIENVRAEDVDGIERQQISQTMGLVVEYFEEASRQGLLKRSMESKIKGYKYEGHCHKQVERGVLQSLYKRMDKLVFT